MSPASPSSRGLRHLRPPARRHPGDRRGGPDRLLCPRIRRGEHPPRPGMVEPAFLVRIPIRAIWLIDPRRVTRIRSMFLDRCCTGDRPHADRALPRLRPARPHAAPGTARPPRVRPPRGPRGGFGGCHRPTSGRFRRLAEKPSVPVSRPRRLAGRRTFPAVSPCPGGSLTGGGGLPLIPFRSIDGACCPPPLPVLPRHPAHRPRMAALPRDPPGRGQAHGPEIGQRAGP